MRIASKLTLMITASALAGTISALAWPDAPVPAAEPVAALPDQFPPACTAISPSERMWGVQVLAAKLSRNRRSLEVRLRVLDYDKAQRLTNALLGATVVELNSGVQLRHPKISGAAMPATGQVLRLTFDNAALLGAKQRVLVQIGGFRKSNIRVIG